MNPSDPRRLTGLRFGLSISAASDLPNSLEAEQTVKFASSILLEGGGLLIGHRWMPDGIMEYLAFQARDGRLGTLKRKQDEGSREPVPILNLIAWPDEPPFDDRNALRMIKDGILEVRRIDPPGIPTDQLEDVPTQPLDSKIGELARIRALTAMRQEMALLTDARICLGGASGNPLRRLPGIIEEALLAHAAGKPLFISSALGGAAKAMSDAILRRRMDEAARAMFFTPPDVVDLFATFAHDYPAPESEGPSTESGWNALQAFETLDLGILSRQAGLTEDEYIQVLTSPDVIRVLGLAITGTLRLRENGAAKTE